MEGQRGFCWRMERVVQGHRAPLSVVSFSTELLRSGWRRLLDLQEQWFSEVLQRQEAFQALESVSESCGGFQRVNELDVSRELVEGEQYDASHALHTHLVM